MLPELVPLPPGVVPLVLILGGLAFALPVAVATLLEPQPRKPKASRHMRAVLVTARPPGKDPLQRDRLPPLDAALERVHQAGMGDPRILFSDAHRKLVRVAYCACTRGGRSGCEATRVALAQAFREVLAREPVVTEITCTGRRCEYLVQY